MADEYVDGGRPQQQQQDDHLIKIDFEWIKTTFGKLLIAELLLCFLCGACASSVVSWANSGCPGRMGFLDFVAWTAFLNLLIDLILRILGLWSRIHWVFHHPMLHLILSLLAVLGFLIGSSLSASCAKASLTRNHGAAAAGAVFGFVCLILFSIEAFLHFRRYKNMEAEARQQTTSDEFKADVI
ncbi:uncharacterized protein LOC116614507 [Nematostella vectensis]|uniref:uncharacterized protein LOC116614507 n=1 Tax=Nematostella vectensis TaxID=45351 RepID=UPI0020770FBB|nr:uncharacterized protein LOC116614507 [Nematostella vectensis]